MLFLSILCVFGPPLFPILRGQPCIKMEPSHLITVELGNYYVMCVLNYNLHFV